MNLFDMVNRKDRSVQWIEGLGEARALKWPGGTQRGVEFQPGTRLRIVDAHEFTSLRVRPQSPGWQWAVAQARGTLIVSIETADGASAEIAALEVKAGESPKPVNFNWPAARAYVGAFDLEIAAPSGGALAVGPQISLRASVLPLARGVGVEVGPGIAPSVLPAPGIEVTYVEACPLEEWPARYAKSGKPGSLPPAELAARYVVDSAVSLDAFADARLDFVFSNHVFEHLANPIPVLKNWLRVLKPGGVVAGVTPDPRYTFDCRQPIMTLSEALTEAEQPGHEITRAKYERWVRWTSPGSTPESLIKREYSIHVNFFTPDTFADVVDHLKKSGDVADATIIAAPNQKDFAFALWKR